MSYASLSAGTIDSDAMDIPTDVEAAKDYFGIEGDLTKSRRIRRRIKNEVGLCLWWHGLLLDQDDGGFLSKVSRLGKEELKRVLELEQISVTDDSDVNKDALVIHWARKSASSEPMGAQTEVERSLDRILKIRQQERVAAYEASRRSPFAKSS